MEWTKNQHRRKVLERNASRVSSLANPIQDVIDNALFNDPTPVVPTTERKESKMVDYFSTEQQVDDFVEPLINRRKALVRSKDVSFAETNHKNRQGGVTVGNDPDEGELEEEEEEDSIMELNLPQPTKDYLTDLKKTFDKNVSKAPNNYQVKQLYQKAKAADQAGDIQSAKMYLLQLHNVTPQDTRVIRRLARLESQEGNMERAREILQSALRSMPKSGDLLQGLAQMEVSCGNTQKCCTLWQGFCSMQEKITSFLSIVSV